MRTERVRERLARRNAKRGARQRRTFRFLQRELDALIALDRFRENLMRFKKVRNLGVAQHGGGFQMNRERLRKDGTPAQPAAEMEIENARAPDRPDRAGERRQLQPRDLGTTADLAHMLAQFRQSACRQQRHAPSGPRQRHAGRERVHLARPATGPILGIKVKQPASRGARRGQIQNLPGRAIRGELRADARMTQRMFVCSALCVQRQQFHHQGVHLARGVGCEVSRVEELGKGRPGWKAGAADQRRRLPAR